MSKKFVSLLLFVTMVMSMFGGLSLTYAEEQVISEVVYDFTGDEVSMSSTFDGVSTSKMPLVIVDGVTTESAPVAFRNYSNTSAAVVDGKSVLRYAGAATDKNTYIRWYGRNDLGSISYGRLVFTGKYYSNTENVSGTFTINRKGDNECVVNLWKANEGPKANTWYNYKYVVDMDLDKNNVSYSFTEASPKNSEAPHTISKTATYRGSTFLNIWADIDVLSGDSSDFCAYRDFKLTYNTHSSYVNAISNGNKNSTTYDNGVFTAETSGSGLFAIALYKKNEMVNISFAENEDELESVRLNMVIDDIEDTTMKIFRFDGDFTPICINKTLTPRAKDYRVYFNETFDNGSSKLSTTNVTSDGQIKISGYNTRYGGVAVNYPDRYYVVEADYTIPEGAECADAVRLLCVYNDSPISLIYMNKGGIYAGKYARGTLIMPADEFKAKGKVSVACVIDLDEFSYDVYLDKELKAENVSLTTIMDYNTRYGGATFYAAYFYKVDYTIYLDNYKAYSGNQLMDIGDDISTSHKLDFKNSSVMPTNIYERPLAGEIAKKALETGHPRLLINSDRVEEIKNTTDARMIKWKQELFARADNYLSTNPYTYALSSTDSIQDVPESIALMMDLGLAYLLTGDTKYSDRAYEEVSVVYTVPYVKYNGTAIPEETRDYWNSYSYLDVGELSFVLGLCYDWMYDAWTDEQRAELTQNIMDRGLIRSYRTIFGNSNPTNLGSNGWYKSTNNWNAVCNGGVMMSAIAFMEADPYLCGTVAEGTVRGFEYMLSNYAPAGAWTEGAGYWSYALKYLTAATATLDAACGTDFGISKTTGLEGTQLYSLSIEGKTGVMNYGDGGSSRVNAPFMFYWANKYKNNEIGGAALYIKEVFGYTASCFDLVYYHPEYVTEGYIPPLSFYYPGTEVVSFASGYDPDDTYISMSGGLGVATSHDHLDSGGLVLEMKGKRLFNDIGAEHYGANGYFSTNRYLYFRARPESHSVFVIDPMRTSDADGNVYYGQSKSAVSAITNYDASGKTATMDLSDAYSRDASAASRTLALNGDTAIITDNITLKDTKDVYWNWYVRTYDTSNKKSLGSITVSDDGKSAVIKLGETVYNVSFETNCNYTLAVQAADYYVNVDPDVGGRKHKNTDYQRLVLKLEGASGSVSVKTIVE